MPAALGVADHGGDPGPGPCGELSARLPTPPAAPVINTRLPSSGAPCRKVRNAVKPGDRQCRRLVEEDIVGNAAPCGALGTAARSAQPPSRSTRRRGCRPWGRCRRRRRCKTTPAMSWPGRQPSGRTWNSRNSPRLSENACTSTSASFGRRLGVGNLADRDRGRGLAGVLTMASMQLVRSGGQLTRPAGLGTLSSNASQCGRGGPALHDGG